MKPLIVPTPLHVLRLRPKPYSAIAVACVLLLFCAFSVPMAQAQEPPLPPGAIIADCGPGDPLGDESPDQSDIVGDTANGFWSGLIWHDANFLHFGLRVNGDPSGTRGFDQKAWVALMNVPSGNPFQYQYLLSLNGNNVPGFSNDTVEIWENDAGTAQNISFSPIFNDPAETNLQRKEYNNGTGPTSVCFGNNLACFQQGGSTIDGNPDYLVFWAVSVTDLINAGVISQASDLNNALFFLATSANANNYNKDHLACPFAPPSVLDIDKNVTPNSIQQGGSMILTYTIDVTNTSSSRAVGVVIEDHDFAACMSYTASNVTVTPSTGASIETASAPDLVVRLDELAAGASVSVQVVVDASACPIQGYENIASTFATNAPSVMDGAFITVLLPVELTSFDAQVNGRKALLTWETASETNNAGFEIQHLDRTAGPEAWHAMDFIEGHGTTALPQTYQYEIDNLGPGHHTFRLKQIDYDGAFEYSPEVEIIVEMVERFVLEPVYPNPFNPQAQFRFAVQWAQDVQIDLFDMLGRRVRTLYAGRAEAGQMQTVRIDGSNLPSGLYVVRVVGDTFIDTQQVTLLR